MLTILGLPVHEHNLASISLVVFSFSQDCIFWYTGLEHM